MSRTITPCKRELLKCITCVKQAQDEGSTLPRTSIGNPDLCHTVARLGGIYLCTPWRCLQGAKEELVEAGWDGLLLGGNYVAGVALGKCVEYAYTFAGEVAEHLRKRTQTPSTGPAPASAGADEGFFV